VNRLRLGRSGARIPTGAYLLIFSETSERIWSPPRFLSIENRGLFTGVKWHRHKVDHSPPTNAEDKNGWSCVSIPPMPPWHGQGKLYRFQNYVIRQQGGAVV